MVRALQRSILGRNCGASFCSTIIVRTPRNPRSMASVRPVGPAPTMRTCASIVDLISPGRARAFPVITPNISIRGFHLSGFEIGELGSLLHEIAHGALERLEAPLGGRPQ